MQSPLLQLLEPPPHRELHELKYTPSDEQVAWVGGGGVGRGVGGGVGPKIGGRVGGRVGGGVGVGVGGRVGGGVGQAGALPSW